MINACKSKFSEALDSKDLDSLTLSGDDTNNYYQ